MTALTARGYRGPGQGRASYVQAPREWRGTTVQAWGCGRGPSPRRHRRWATPLATWADGFAAIEAANALADHDAGPQRRVLVVLDELWRVLRAGEGLVDRVDELTRLNRNKGVGQVMVTHSLADLRALPHEHDRAKARGFVERSGAVIVGGLPARELDELAEVVPFTRAERDLVTSWSTPPGWGESAAPPGRGNFLIKAGTRAGIPFHLELSPAETGAMGDSNRRWRS